MGGIETTGAMGVNRSLGAKFLGWGMEKRLARAARATCRREVSSR